MENQKLKRRISEVSIFPHFTVMVGCAADMQLLNWWFVLLMLCSRCSENKRNFSSYFTTTRIRLREEFTHPCIQALIRFAMQKFYSVCVCVCVCMCARVCARTHPNVCKKLFVYRGKQVRAHIMIGEYCNSSISPIAAAPIIS